MGDGCAVCTFLYLPLEARHLLYLPRRRVVPRWCMFAAVVIIELHGRLLALFSSGSSSGSSSGRGGSSIQTGSSRNGEDGVGASSSRDPPKGKGGGAAGGPSNPAVIYILLGVREHVVKFGRVLAAQVSLCVRTVTTNLCFIAVGVRGRFRS